MFLGLIVTSIGFILPSLVAKNRGKALLACSYKCIAITSLLYHSTQSRFFHLIDKYVVHGICAFHLSHALVKIIKKPSLQKVATFGSTSLPVFIYFGKSKGKDAPLWHMGFHISGQALLSLYAIYF